MATTTTTFEQIMGSVKKGLSGLAPVYLLHGEEGYYTDRLVEAFADVVPEGERDFNLTVVYAPSTSASQIVQAARRFPMMAERQVVIVKEAQAVGAKELDKLAPILAEPSPQTVLVIAVRGAQAKGREFMAAARKGGAVIYESKKLKDGAVSNVLGRLIKEKGLNIEPKGLAMMTDHVGADLSRIYNEVNKLAVALPSGSMVTPEAIERLIGVNKDYNNFELVDAIAGRNGQRAYTIIRHFADNAKENPWPVTLTVLFNFFSDLLIYQFAPDKKPEVVGKAMGAKSAWVVQRYERASRHYNAYQTLEIISELRRTDVASKGIGSRQDAYKLLEELVFHILNAPGRLPVSR